MSLFFVCCFFILSIKNFSFQHEPRVTTDKVTYIGSYLESWNKDAILAFRGIQYAEPPIGSLRFKDPKPLNHNNIFKDYNATVDGNDCPSLYTNSSSEDCLFLNVYTRSIPKSNDLNSLRPVIAFIHPGGFYIGSSSSSSFGPEYLLTHNIVLVTFNYRLGALGFLNLGTKDVPGNAGLKDQVIALRWIQRNINAFGGNPKNVTLMGYSAGAFSVSLHLVSPMSQELFQNAIIMSGSIPPQMKIQKNQMDLAMRQAKIMGCDNVNKSESSVIECLNKFSGNQIASTLRSMFDFGKDNPVFLWKPVLEENFGQERFLIDDPYESFKNGKFNKVPVLTGFTSNELCTSAIDILQNSTLLESFNQNFLILGPICFMYKNCSENDNAISTKLWKYYFTNKLISEDNFSELCDIFSDSIIRFGSHSLAEIISQMVPVYTYKFSYVGRYTNLVLPEIPRKGAEHMDDLLYIFTTKDIKFSQNDPEANVVKTMTNLIISFLEKSVPIATNERYDFISKKYIDIKEFFEIKDGRNFERTEIWNELFPK